MNGFLKAGAMIALAVLCCGFLPGCGERSAERKIRSEAKSYIKEKYGFSPEITGFEFRHVGELEWKSHKKDAGYVTMTHDGREFKAYISPKDPDVNCDNFMQKDVDDRLTAYFREQLGCQDIAVETTYGSFIRCGVPADIRSYEELFAGCDNICIYVSAYALDREKVSALDVSKLGKTTEVTLVECHSASDLQDEKLWEKAAVWRHDNGGGEYAEMFKAYYHFRDGETEKIEK